MAVAEPIVEVPTVTIDPPRGAIGFDLKPLWEYRQLLFFFTWRDLKVRYKQTVLGASWAILQPLLATIVFTIFFGRVAHSRPTVIPYLLFSFSGTLPWTYFSNAITAGSNSLVSAQTMIAKVYFPRIALPISAVLGAAFDLLCASVMLIPIMAWYGIAPLAAPADVAAVLPAREHGGARHVVPSVGPQRALPRRQVRAPVPDPALDVRHAGRVLVGIA